MDAQLLSYNSKTDELLYEEGSIILFNHDGAEVRCGAFLYDIAEVNGHEVDTWMEKQEDGSHKRIWCIDNWITDKWQPTTDELYYYLMGHKSECTLWIDHEAEYPCRHLIEEAERLGIEVITWDSGLRDKTNQLQQTIKTLAI